MIIQVARRVVFRLSICAATWLTLALAGCDGGASKATVAGAVTYKGKPLPTGTIAFIGKDNKVVSAAIESNGRYSVARVPVGPAKISVSTPPAPPKGAAAAGMPVLETVSIPAQYNDPEKSGLTYDVKPGAQEHSIDLK